MIPGLPAAWITGAARADAAAEGAVKAAAMPEVITPDQVPFFAWFYSVLVIAGIVTLFLIWRPLQARTALWERRTRYIVRRPFTWGDLVLILFTLFALYPAGALLLDLAWADLDPMSQQVLVQSITFHWAILVMLVILLRIKGIRWERAFGLYRGRIRKDVAMGATGYLAMMPVVLLYGIISWVILHTLGFKQDVQEIARVLSAGGSPAMRIYKFLVAAAIAPVAEELLFRGIAFPLISRRFGSLTGIIVVSAVFAGIHVHLPAMLPLFIMSTFLCMAYVHTGSLRVPIVMHMLFNTLNLTMHILMN